MKTLAANDTLRALRAALVADAKTQPPPRREAMIPCYGCGTPIPPTDFVKHGRCGRCDEHVRMAVAFRIATPRSTVRHRIAADGSAK